ncbi:DinB family protein [Prosthecochloris sp. N3]|uniref:DinB family protein n=2 Tax=Prosthecochloris TaxID=1101 RepID=A0ABR9XUK0_9CHLB|nr:DinB family protein [Prosthecochloris ethylica]MBF0586997.1 DinB family protein [Prosthecochloris ethylica]MBF0637480.1 DinB family protein [Prosthecochloris ethylica]NUK48514.1 DinB family protein [Prosthecochloris ethylica]
MNWTSLLHREIDALYPCTVRLIDLLDQNDLQWKPSTGTNWMTTAQLLMHLSTACGVPMKDFVTGDSGIPEDLAANQLTFDEMLPPAEHMPAAQSIPEALELLEQDRQMAGDAIDMCSENDLEQRLIPALWDPTPMPLGYRLLQMTGHLNQHKTQLYYYLKLMGKPVNTRTLYGI